MAILGKVAGTMLKDNLVRNGTDLILDSNLVYFDVNNRRVGISTLTPGNVLSVNGSVTASNIYILNSNITSLSGNLYLKTVSGNISVSTLRVTDMVDPVNSQDAATKNYVDTTIAATVAADLFGNLILLGPNTSGALVSNAVTLTTTTTVTNGLAQLNLVLGKLVPPAPGNFPNNGALSLSGLSTLGRMTNFTQTDNTGWGNLSVAAGTSVTTGIRAATITTNTFSRQGPGDSGNVQVIINGAATGYRIMNPGNNNNGTYGHLIISANQDYSVLSGGSGGFWSSFSAQASGSNAQAGWNQIYLTDSSGSGTNTATWYYDINSPGAPVWSNTSIALTTNSTTFSSTVPHLNSSSQWRLAGNVAKLSGDTYYTSDTFITGSAGGAMQTPTSVTYTQAGVTTPLVRNAYVTSGSAYFTTTASGTASGFGSSSSGPSMTVYNSYSSAANTFNPGVTVLYKNGTSTQIEETSMTNALTGAPSTFRIVNPDAGSASDTPSFTGSESAFNSSTGPFYTTDATIVAAVLKFDQTNYSTGYQPVGPNLSGQGAAQYYTFKFAKSAVAKFNIAYSGTIAGLWVALPGISTTYSTLNGWYSMSTAYAGSGIPGANTGAGGNGSNGCAVGGTAVIGSLVSNGSYTATFGTVNTSSAGNIGNEIYVRVKLTSGQSLTALSIQAATN
jgi:hypothetical protein